MVIHMKEESQQERNIRVGAQLRSARERLGISTEKMSEITDLSPQAINQIELGHRSRLNMGAMVKYGLAVGYTPDQIAQLYGWFRPEKGTEDERLLRIINMIKTIPEERRAALLPYIEAIIDAEHQG